MYIHYHVMWVRVGHFGSKLAKNGPFWSFWVKIGQKWSVLIILGLGLGLGLVILGPNWPIMVRFGHFRVRVGVRVWVRVGHFGSKLAKNGPFWSFWIKIGQ